MEYAAGIERTGSTCFILTISWSLPEDVAVELNTKVSTDLFELGRSLGTPVLVVSRSDSTLRGHVIAEMRALNAAHRRVTGTGFDGMLFYSRHSSGPVHRRDRLGQRVRENRSRPATRTCRTQPSVISPNAGFRGRSDGSITADQVHSLTLEDILLAARIGWPKSSEASAVANSWWRTPPTTPTSRSLFSGRAGAGIGQDVVYGFSPSFPQVLAGLATTGTATAEQIWPAGNPGGHGSAVVGSHVGLTSRQVAKAQERGGMTEAELHVPTLIDRPPGRPCRRHRASGHRGPRHLRCAAVHQPHPDARWGCRRQPGHLAQRFQRGHQGRRRLHSRRTSWVVAKGGITSHDVAVRGLGIRRAEGAHRQPFPGMVSVFRPIEASGEAVGTVRGVRRAMSAATKPSRRRRSVCRSPTALNCA